MDRTRVSGWLGVVVMAAVSMVAVGCTNQDDKNQINALSAQNSNLVARNAELQRQLDGSMRENNDLRDRLAARDEAYDELARSKAAAPPPPPVTVVRTAPAPAPTKTASGWEQGVGGDRVTLSSDILFTPGSATLSPAGEKALAKIANDLKKEYAGMNVRVEAGNSIYDGYDETASFLPNIVAQTAQLVARNDIGHAGNTASDANVKAVDTVVGALAASAGGNIYVQNTGNLELGEVEAVAVTRVGLDSTRTALEGTALAGVTAGNNAKVYNTLGNVRVTEDMVATEGDLLVTALLGNVTLANGVSLTAGNLLALNGLNLHLNNAAINAGSDNQQLENKQAA